MARSITLLVLALGAVVGCRDSMDAQHYKNAVEPEILALLCDHDRPADQLPSYYRNCFDIDEAQCSEVMRRTIHACAGRFVHGIVDESNAGQLAERIGACAGTDYERELESQGKLVRSHACDIARDAYAKARSSTSEP